MKKLILTLFACKTALHADPIESCVLVYQLEWETQLNQEYLEFHEFREELLDEIDDQIYCFYILGKMHAQEDFLYFIQRLHDSED